MVLVLFVGLLIFFIGRVKVCVDRVGESSCLVLMVLLREFDVIIIVVDDGLILLEDEIDL